MSLELESNGGHKSRARIIRQQLITSDKLSSSFFTMLPINYKGDHLSLLKLLLQFLPFSLRMRAGPGHTSVGRGAVQGRNLPANDSQKYVLVRQYWIWIIHITELGVEGTTSKQ